MIPDFTFLNKHYFKFYDKHGYIVYWNRVEKFMKQMERFRIKRFRKYFPHEQIENVCLDDEWRIEIMAKRHGYRVVDEDIQMNKSGYTFERI